MGIFKRPDSQYWWLYLETTKQRERTTILLGDTATQRADAKRLAKDAYQRRMLELAEQKVKRLPERPADDPLRRLCRRPTPGMSSRCAAAPAASSRCSSRCAARSAPSCSRP